MNLFLIIYNRATGEVEVREYSAEDRARALNDRFARELVERKSPFVEVVLLGADSLEDLKRTHSRYFRNPAEIAEAAFG
jgi:hypothetical protein